MTMTMKSLSGIGASPGVAVGPVVRVAHEEAVVPDVDDPHAAMQAAADEAAAHLSQLADRAAEVDRHEAAEVLRAQALMAEDPMLVDQVREHLDAGSSLGSALSDAGAELQAMLAGLGDEYLAARAADIGEVVRVVRNILAGVDSAGLDLREPSVLLAREVTAAETAELDPNLVLGFATEIGGATSHVAIIARSLSVPAVVGVADLVRDSEGHATVAIDGQTGEIVLDPDAEVTERFQQTSDELDRQRTLLGAFQGRTVSYGDTVVEVSANIGGPDDVELAVSVEPDGVGLFRTEFLFLDRTDPPTEDEQFETYRSIVQSFDDTVVLRTFDIGGDKPAPYLDMEEEENPFLGVRGVRLYERFDELFRGQIRAALRASTHGKLAIMIPMIATLSEFTRSRARIDEIAAELDAEGVERGQPEIGIMVEVPSAAVNAGTLAKRVDFFSIGTNDLTQYTMAADRGNRDLHAFSDALDPSVLELVRLTAEAGRANGRSVSVCGLAAADPASAAAFAALGVNKLSVGANSVNLIRATIDALDPSFGQLLDDLRSNAPDAAELRDALTSHLPSLS